MPPLLILSQQRIAAELRYAEAQAAADGYWTARIRRLARRSVSAYLIGLFVAYSSLGLTGDPAEIAFWGGLVIGNGAILAFLFALWALEGE